MLSQPFIPFSPGTSAAGRSTIQLCNGGEREDFLCSLYICCLIAHQHPLGSSTTKIKFYQEGLDGIAGRIPSRRKWLRAAQGSGGVPNPGGIQEMCGRGTEGCGSVMGLQRSGWWLAWRDLEAPFQPRRFCYSTREWHSTDWYNGLPKYLNKLKRGMNVSWKKMNYKLFAYCTRRSVSERECLPCFWQKPDNNKTKPVPPSDKSHENSHEPEVYWMPLSLYLSKAHWLPPINSQLLFFWHRTLFPSSPSPFSNKRPSWSLKSRAQKAGHSPAGQAAGRQHTRQQGKAEFFSLKALFLAMFRTESFLGWGKRISMPMEDAQSCGQQPMHITHKALFVATIFLSPWYDTMIERE